MRRYVKACRQAFEPGYTYGYVCDKSRKCGKDWLAGNLYCYDTDTIGWCSPVARFTNVQKVSPYFSEGGPKVLRTLVWGSENLSREPWFFGLGF